MYALFRMHGWKPSDFYNMESGEQIIVTAFLQQEIEDIEAEMKRYNS